MGKMRVESVSSVADLERLFGSEVPLKRIFQLVIAQGCKCVLIEDDIKYERYWDEFQTFYCMLFEKHPGTAQRAHFFATANLNPRNVAKSQDHYLGYCVLRPTRSQRILEAIIKPPDETSGSLSHTFTICQLPFEVRIGPKKTAQRLVINGFPFVQPDGRTGNCAHGVMAAIDRYLCRKNQIAGAQLRTEPSSIPQIDALASSENTDTHSFPRPGLSPPQIKRALHAMGYCVLMYHPTKHATLTDAQFPARILHYYLESDIPVILGIPTETSGHAMTVVGHSTDPHSWWQMAQEPYYDVSTDGLKYKNSSAWVETFIIHDSNFGPYLKVSKDFICQKAKENLQIIIPTPRNIHARGEDVEPYAYNLITSEVIRTKLNDTLGDSDTSKNTKQLIRLFLAAYEIDELILRTYLIPSDLFVETHSAHLRAIYRKIKMPPQIWVSEISTPEVFANSMRLGEVIVDSTSVLRFVPGFLAVHAPGLLISRDPNTEEMLDHTMPDDKLAKIMMT